MIHKLSSVFQDYKGDNAITFEILETEKTKKLIAAAPAEAEANEAEPDEELAATLPVTEMVEVEETKVITKLEMPSRKKVRISNDLLVQLQKLDVRFRLN